jgi:hypothetical protein
MAINRRSTAALAALLFAASGCLLKEVNHTWYLDPASGAVTWTVFEHDVRSDAATLADRTVEELQYWNAVQTESHPVAMGLREFGGLDLRTRVIRSRVPYSVVTDATFPTIDELGQRLIVLAGLTGSSQLERDGDVVQWTLTVRDPHAEEESSSSDAVSALLAEFNTLRVVLADGRFVEPAVGFTLDADRRVARFQEPDVRDEDAFMELRLRWTVPGAAARPAQPAS